MKKKKAALEAEKKAKEKEAADKAPAGKGKKDAKKAAAGKKKWSSSLFNTWHIHSKLINIISSAEVLELYSSSLFPLSISLEILTFIFL